MADAIEAAPLRYPFRFVVAGDSGAWADPTADAIFGTRFVAIRRTGDRRRGGDARASARIRFGGAA